MSFSYNNIIDRTKNKDRESNKNFNITIILNSNNKKKSSQEDIDCMINKTCGKIFNVITVDEKNYFLDKELSMIWDEDAVLVGLYNNKKYFWFNEFDSILEDIINDNKELNILFNK